MKTTQQEQYIHCLKSIAAGNRVLMNDGVEVIVEEVNIATCSVFIWPIGRNNRYWLLFNPDAGWPRKAIAIHK